MSTGSPPSRLERAVYVRTRLNRQEYGYRCDGLDGRTQWHWGYPTQVRARHAYEAARARVREARRSGVQLTPTQATVATLAVEALRASAGKRASLKDMRRHLTWWGDRLGRQPVLTLRATDIERGLAALRGRGLSGATANRYAATLRHLMRKYVVPLAWVQELWRHVERYPEVPDVRPVLSDVQEERLYAQLDPYDALVVRLAVLLGLRIRQFFALRWEWVNWADGALALPGFKRHPPRQLPLVHEALALLAVLRSDQRDPETGPVFPSRRQTYVGVGRGKWRRGPMTFDPRRPMNARNWYRRRFAPAVGRARLPAGITFHSLRHTWASRMGAHTPARVLQILGGWRSLALVERYCHPHEAALRAAMERVSDKTSVKKVSRTPMTPRVQVRSH